MMRSKFAVSIILLAGLSLSGLLQAAASDYLYRTPINYYQGKDAKNNISILQISDHRGTGAGKVLVKLEIYDEAGTFLEYETALNLNEGVHPGDGAAFAFLMTETVEQTVGPIQGVAHGYILTSVPVVVVNYMRSGDGFLTEINSVLEAFTNSRYVPLMNDSSNANVELMVALTNDEKSALPVTITGFNTFGNLGDCTATIPAQGSFMVDTNFLENTCFFTGSSNDDGSISPYIKKMRLKLKAGGNYNAALITRQISSGKLANISNMNNTTEEISSGTAINVWDL